MLPDRRCTTVLWLGLVRMPFRSLLPRLYVSVVMETIGLHSSRHPCLTNP